MVEPSAGGDTAACIPTRAQLAEHFPSAYRAVMRRLARARPFPSESDALAAYSLAMLGAELRVHGEPISVVGALADACLRCPGGAATSATAGFTVTGGSTPWFNSRGQMVKLLRRWLGDSGAFVHPIAFANSPRYKHVPSLCHRCVTSLSSNLQARTALRGYSGLSRLPVTKLPVAP